MFTGFFIRLQKEGWNCEGLELNPSAVNFGLKRGLRIFQSTLRILKQKI